MRLDKYLKAARLVKRRTLAKAMCDQGRVEVNGRTAKAGTQVAVGDQLVIRYGQKELTVQVNHLAESPRKEEAGQLYTVLKEERIEHSDPD